MANKYKLPQRISLFLFLLLFCVTVSGAPKKVFWMAPTISSFPSSACVDEVITISGNHFTGTLTVDINGALALFSVIDNNTIEATVPSGASSVGVITITNAIGSTPSSTSFFAVALPSGTPSITTPNGTEFCAGSSVEISANGTLGSNEVYQWYEDGAEMGGENGSTLEVTNAADYTLTIKNIVTGCQTAESSGVTITENAVPSGTPTITTPNGTEFCSGDTLEISANGTLGTNEEYQWLQDGIEMTGENSATLEVLDGGDYSLVIQNTVTGCETTASADETITENSLPNQPTITTVGSTTFCDDDDVTLVAPANFTTYNWFLDGGSGGLNTQSITTNLAGDYTLIVTDANSCSSPESAPITVTVNASPSVDAGTPVTICEGQSANLNANATGGDGAYTFSWSPTTDLSNPNIKNPVADPSSTITYTVTATDGNGCFNTDDLTITVNDTPVVNIISNDADNIICEDDEITFTATGPSGTLYEFFINNTSQGAPSTTSTLTTSSLTAGSSDIKVTGTLNGCSITTQDLEVTVNSTTTVDILHPTQTSYTIEKDTVNLVGSPTGGVFSGPAVADDVFYAENLGVGGPYTITYTFTNGNGCTSVATHDIDITNTSAILIDAEYCANDADVILTSSDVPDAPALGISPTTHHLVFLEQTSDNTQGGVSPTSPNSAPYTFSPSSLTPGIYILEVVYKEIGAPRFVQFDQKVRINAIPTVSIDGLDTEYCFSNTTVNFEASTNSGTFSWTGVSSGSSGFDPTLNLNISGDANTDTVHNVMLTYTDGNNCSNTASQSVTIHGLPTVDFSGLDPEYCFSDAAITLTGTQSGGSYTGEGTTDNGNGTASFDPRTAFLTEESDSTAALSVSFDITYRYTDGNSCADSVTHTVDINELPNVAIDKLGPGPLKTEYCIDDNVFGLQGMPVPGGGDTGIFSGNGITDSGTGNAGFDPANAAIAAGATSATDTNTFHTITYTFTNNDGCVNKANVEMTVYKLPTVSFAGLNTAKAYCHNDEPILLVSDSVPSAFTEGEFDLIRSGFDSDFALTDNGDGTAWFDPRKATEDVGADSAGGVNTIHILEYEYEDANGCENTFRDTITVYPLPALSFSGVSDMDEFCYTDPAIVVTGIPTGATGSFSGLGITDNGDGTANYEPDSAAFYAGQTNPVFTGQVKRDITYTYTDGNNCTNAESIELRVNPLPNVILDDLDEYYCFDDELEDLDGTPVAGAGISGVLTGNGVTDFGDGSGEFNPETAANNVGITNPTASNSTHIITYTFTNNNGCTNSDSDTTVVRALPIVSFTGLGDHKFCVDDTVITLTGAPVGDETNTFGQFTGDGISDPDTDSQGSFNPTVAFNPAPGDSTFVANITYNYLDEFGCINSIADTATIHDLPTVFFTGFDPSQTYCMNDGSFTLTGRSPEGNPVAFFGDGIQTDNGNGTAVYSPRLAFLNQGLDSLSQTAFDEVKYAFTDANGCTDTARVVFTILPLSDIVNFADQSVCYDGTINLMPSPTNGLATFFTGDGITDNGNGTAVFDAETAALAVGALGPTDQITTHTATYTFTNNNGCTNSESITLTVNPLPVVSFSGLGDKEFCVDEDPVELVGSPIGNEINTGGFFLIDGHSDNDFDSKISFIPEDAYKNLIQVGDSVVKAPVYYEYTDSLNCTNSIIDTATIYGLPTVFFSGYNASRTYCMNDDSFVLTGRTPEGNPVAFLGDGILTDNGDGTAIYSPRKVFTTQGLDSLSQTGVDQVKYAFTDIHGCSDTATVTITIRPLSPIANFADQSVCYDGTINLTPSPTNGLATFFTGDGITDNGNGTAVFDAETAALAAGASGPTDQVTTHTITYTFTNNNGCTNSESITLTVNPLPVVSFSGLGDKEYCVDENPVELTGTPIGNEINTGGFFLIDGHNDNNFDSKISFVPEDAYKSLIQVGDSVVKAPVYYEYTDSLSCTNSITDTATIYGLPTVFFSGYNASRTYCMNDDSFVLTGRTPEGNPVAFLGDGILTDNGDGTAIYSPRKVFTTQGLDSLSQIGVDQVKYAFTDVHGCSDTATVTITIRPLSPISNFADQSVCYDGTINLSPSPTNGLGTVFTGDGITDNGNGTAVFDAETAALAAGASGPTDQVTTHQITYIFTNNNGCTNDSTITLTVNPLPVVSFSGLADEYCYDGPTITLAGSPLGTNGEFDGRGIDVDFNNGSATYSPSKAAISLGATSSTDRAVTDTVTYTFEDGNGCVNSFSDTVVINPLPEVSITGFDPEYCYDASADDLIGSPAVISGTSGVFSGNGITDSPDSLLTENGDGFTLFLPELAATQAGAPSSTSQITNHQITYLYTDVKGCSNSETVTIRVNPLPSVGIVPVTLTYCYDAAPFALTANPKDTTGIKSGFFTGRGITDFLNGNAEFNPADAAVQAGISSPTQGNSDHTITYTYSDANSCVNSDSITFTVFALPDISFTLDDNGLNSEKEYCPSTPEFTLRSSLPELSNTLAIFSGDGVIDQIQGLGKFDPNDAVLASGRNPETNHTDTTQHVIRLFYTDANSCSNNAYDTLTINPLPKASFEVLNNCGVDPINFEGSGITNTSIDSWFWDFGDNTNAIVQNPSHLYASTDFYDVSLTITTDKECSDDTTRQIQIGGKPTAGFNFIRICFNDTVFYSDQSFVANTAVDTITNWTWDFDDATGIGSSNTIPNPFHVYSDTGTYTVTFAVETNNGCVDTTSQVIDILPVVPVTNFPYFESFETGDGSWSTGGVNNSWEHGEPAGDNINFTPAGNRVWMTKLDSTYKQEEMSYVDGPCFDFGILERPMISMKVWSETDPSRDGAVLQFSEDDGLTWQSIGDLTSPYNWYDQNIASQPGGSPSGSPAWTGSYNGWRTVRHELDALKGRAVRLRVAFGSDAAEDLTDGFAFDEVWIGERSKTVLIEHFTNSSNANDATFNPTLNDAINSFATEDVVAIQYHLESDAGKVPDPFNVYNPTDPSARALHYGISETPNTVVDGSLFSQSELNTNLLRRAVLGDPDLLGIAAFDLDLTFDELPNETLNARLDIQANDTITGEVLVHLAVIERSVDLTSSTANGETHFEWVLKKLLPDGAGTSFNQTWLPNDQTTVTQSWELLDIENPNEIAVVAFIQQNNTSGGASKDLQVYQAAYAKPSVVPPVVTTGLEDELPEALKETVLYPNPANDRVFVVFGGDVTEDYQWDLYNNMGQVLQKGDIKKGSNGFTVGTSTLPQGVYFVRVVTEKAQLIRKVMITH